MLRKLFSLFQKEKCKLRLLKDVAAGKLEAVKKWVELYDDVNWLMTFEEGRRVYSTLSRRSGWPLRYRQVSTGIWSRQR